MNNNNEILNKYIADQFDYGSYRKIVEIFINLIETLLLTIGDYETGISITPKYEMDYAGFHGKLTNSKIESFLIKDYNTEQKVKACIKKYTYAFNKLNDIEKQIFYKTFVIKEKDSILKEEYEICNNELNKIRKSAVIKFSLYLGFDKIIHKLFNNN